MRMTAAQLIAMQQPKPAAKKREDREGPIHRGILAHLRKILPAGSIVHHSANSIGLSGALIMRQIAHNEAMGTVKGFPDLLCLLPGPRVWLFEVKADGNYPDKDQRKLHDDLRALGCMLAVVRSTADVDVAIEEWNRLPTVEEAWVPNDYRDLRNRIVGEAD